MNGPRHMAFSAASTPAALAVIGRLLGTPWDRWQVAASIPIAVITATAPDLDNLKASRKVDGVVRDEVLGGGGPLGHRQLLHWWGVPVGLGYAATFADLGDVGWIVYAALWGYLSHIVLDLPFGEEGFGTRAGVPVFLWYGRVGGWFYSDRLAADLAIWPICLGLCWWTFGFPGADHIPAWLDQASNLVTSLKEYAP